MTKAELLKLVDHTLLSATATETDIRTVCDDGIKYNCASICIPGTHIKFASDYVDGKIKVCAVAGFPLGYNTTAILSWAIDCRKVIGTFIGTERSRRNTITVFCDKRRRDFS